MKQTLISIALGVALLCSTSETGHAATWNDSYGVGSVEGYFSASGVPLAVISSVISNAYYVIEGGALSQGAPLFRQTIIKGDLVAGTITQYVPTNSWVCASNQPAGTNILWLTTTNAGLATNDILVLQGGDGTSQLLVLSGNATDSAGLVYTNAVGYVGVKVFTTPTNTITAGDKIYKMAARQSFSLLAMTNTIGPSINLLSPLGQSGAPYEFRGVLSGPTALVLTYSNAAALLTYGDFKRREY